MPKRSPPAVVSDALLGAVCHDLRAPLSAVTMGASFVLRTAQREDWGARTATMLESMLRSCAQMERLIASFADLAELESHSVELELEVHDAGAMLELVAKRAREAAGARALTIELPSPGAPVRVQCDAARVTRALGHVVDYAVHRAPLNSAVSLALEERGASVIFAVADRGPELAPEVRRHLFDHRWQARHANRTAAAFGLAVARGVLVAHRGRLVVDSQEGLTTFELRLPKEGTHE